MKLQHSKAKPRTSGGEMVLHNIIAHIVYSKENDLQNLTQLKEKVCQQQPGMWMKCWGQRSVSREQAL